jgi:hypothetical protein
MRASSLFALGGALLVLAVGCKEGELKGPAAEVPETTDVKLDLPQVPEFKMPQANADGTHSPTEMRLKGFKYIDTEVKVKGFVVWIYDCATAIRTPEMDDKAVEKLLKEEPERCQRPNFFVADSANMEKNKGIWVVDVPRPPREDEKKALPKEELAAWPEVPTYAIGDEIIIEGKWATASPLGFRNSDGLMVYKGLTTVNAANPEPEKKK